MRWRHRDMQSAAGVRVTVGRVTVDMVTDGSGYLRFKLPPETSIQLELADAHEVELGDSASTSSGNHFSAEGAS